MVIRASVDLKTETNKIKMATVHRLVKEPNLNDRVAYGGK